MEVDKKKISWSNHLEYYFRSIAEKSFCYGYLHKKAESHFSYYRNYIDLPVIVLSTTLGTLSIGGEGVFGENEKIASLCVGAGSIFVGILSTIGTYFGFSKRTEAHKIAHIEYSKLYRFLQIELALPIEERMNATDLLKMTRDNYERLQEIAPLIPQSILHTFKKRFYNNELYKDIAKPSECNGLEKISIYNETNKDNVYSVLHSTKDSLNKTIEDVEKEIQEGVNNVNEVHENEVHENEVHENEVV